jgi:alpha-tubulin suppressor-like RCC1 family protein
VVAQTGAGIQIVLQTPISWQSGASHCVILDYNHGNGTALFLDGVLAAQGGGVPPVPVSLGQLVLGSTIFGTNTAGADIDEFSSFDRLLTDSDAASYYTMTGPTAALGPVSGEEQAEMETIHTPGNVYDPGYETNCSTGGKAFITNVVATVQTNGLMTVTFEIYGTNGMFYDIYATPNLLNTMSNNQWTWIGEGLACNSCTFSNQPADQAFYLLEVPVETFTVAFDGDDTYGELTVPTRLTNAVAIAAGAYFNLALRNNGTVIGWGDNTYNQTNIPTGLTNVVDIAAGEYHGVALLANGSVTNWGTYYAPVTVGTNTTNYYCAVTDRTHASAPPTSGVLAVAAGQGQDLALMSNGTCVAWGFVNIFGNGPAYGTQVPSNLNLTNVESIACGWGFNLALSSNGTITSWGNDFAGIYNLTNVPGDLTTNVAAIAAGGFNSVALRKNGTVEAWGSPDDGVTDVPSGLSNVVAVATGGESGVALQENGNIVIWGDSTLTNIPAGMAGVKAISAGFDDNLVLESGILDPVIFTQPVNQVAPTSSNVTFSAQGAGVAGVHYQWQFNGATMTGDTNANLTLTDVTASTQGNYDVVVTTDGASITSSVVSFTLVVAPGVGSTTPTNTGVTWINFSAILSVTVTNIGQSPTYPIQYYWQFNGTNVLDGSDPNYFLGNSATNEGAYSVGVSNVVGGTNLTWDIRLALPGMVEAWGSDGSGECNRPATLTNVAGIAAGEYQSVAITDAGTVAQWGKYSNNGALYSVTSGSATQPPTNGVVAVAAGLGQALALTTSNTVIAWGVTSAPGATIPTGVQTNGISAIACGFQFDLALSNGTVIAWGNNTSNQTSVPSNLSNVIAIAAGAYHGLALQSNGIVVAWGNNGYGQTTVPSTLTNVVAIAAGDEHSLALQSNGTVVAWGSNSGGQTNVPAGLSNVMAIAAGSAHSVALLNTGTLVAWGTNSSGQTTIPGEFPTVVNSGSPLSPENVTNPPIVVKLIAAGGNHTMAAIWSPLVQYPINVAKDLLLIYNTASTSYSSFIWSYYMTHRPMVSNANSIPISCPTNEQISLSTYNTSFSGPISNWLSMNPTKRPQYVILFQDLPSQLIDGALETSVQYDINIGINAHLGTINYFATWTPFVSSINMDNSGGSNNCINYINKLAGIGNSNSPGKLIISAHAGGYTNTNWYFDDDNPTNQGYGTFFTNAIAAVTNVIPNASVTYTNGTNGTLAGHITNATDVAGFGSWGCHGYYVGPGGPTGTNWGYATNKTIIFSGASGWYLIETAESYNGDQVVDQGNYISWYSTNAFGGTNGSNTPAGAVSNIDEPGVDGLNDPAIYFGDWAAGRILAYCAWNSFPRNATWYLQVVGDPFTER